MGKAKPLPGETYTRFAVLTGGTVHELCNTPKGALLHAQGIKRRNPTVNVGVAYCQVALMQPELPVGEPVLDSHALSEVMRCAVISAKQPKKEAAKP